MVEIDPNLILGIVSTILGIIASYGGVKYQKWKNRAVAIMKLADCLVNASLDDKVDEAEYQQITLQVKETLAELKE